MECGQLIGHFIERANSRSAGIIVMKFPGRERSVAAAAALDFDDAGRSEVGPGEFFLARPDEFYRLACLASQDGRLAGMLAAVACPGIGHDDPDRVIGKPEGPDQLLLHAERSLGSSPDGEL